MRRRPALSLLPVLLCLLVAASARAARFEIGEHHPLQPVTETVWGGNAMFGAPRGAWFDAGLVDSVAGLGINSLRWPGGSRANAYDWRRHAVLRGEPLEDGLDVVRFIALVRELEARRGEPVDVTLMYRFGTGSAADAADFAEFFLAPPGWGLGATRDALLALAGVSPGPVRVRAIEIGNEILGGWEWPYSWTAGDPVRYFLGGDQWRTPEADTTGVWSADLPDRFLHFPADTLRLRFPPCDPDSLTVAEYDTAAQAVTDLWQEAADITQVPVGVKAFQPLADGDGLVLGDGVTHGAQPDSGNVLVVAYKTVGHDGAVAMADSILARVASFGASVPVFACLSPLGVAGLDAAAVQAHFAGQVRHWYSEIDPPAAVGLENQAWIVHAATGDAPIAWARGENVAAQAESSLGLPQSWVLTEWNYHLDEEAAGLWGPGGAAFTALHLAGLATAPDLPRLTGAWQFQISFYRDHLSLYTYDGAAVQPTTRALGFRLARRALHGAVVPVSARTDSVPLALGDSILPPPGEPVARCVGSVEGDGVSLLLVSAAPATASAEPCTLVFTYSLDALRAETWTPVDTTTGAALAPATADLGAGNTYVVDLPARGLVLLDGVRRLTGVPDGPPSLPAPRAVDSPSPRPGLRWSGDKTAAAVEVFDLLGRRVARVPFPGAGDPWRLPRRLPAGLYQVRVVGRDGAVSPAVTLVRVR